MGGTLESRTEATGHLRDRSRRRGRRRAKKERQRGQIVMTVVGSLLLVTGVILGAFALLAPQALERAYGTLRVGVMEGSRLLQEEALGVLPEVRLGGTGDRDVLDLCDGTFTEMASYARAGVPPVWAAHNSCGGEVVLPWEEGQLLRVEGRDEVYAVVDIVYTSKVWSSTADLVGLDGDLALQSCFYGEDRMKFVGLVAVDDEWIAMGREPDSVPAVAAFAEG